MLLVLVVLTGYPAIASNAPDSCSMPILMLYRITIHRGIKASEPALV